MRRDLHGIAVQPSADGSGLVPVDGFLENAMAPRPSFNDKSERGTFLNRVSRFIQRISLHEDTRFS